MGWGGGGLGWGPAEAPGSKSFCSVKEATTKAEHTTTFSVVVSERLTQGTRNSHRNSPLSTCAMRQKHCCGSAPKRKGARERRVHTGFSSA